MRLSARSQVCRRGLAAPCRRSGLVAAFTTAIAVVFHGDVGTARRPRKAAADALARLLDV